MAKLIIIRGNSGSGKTTVARALQRRFGDHSMLISQDMVRREILHVKGEKNMLALPLMQELVEYGRDHCEITILEGILNSQWYEPLFAFSSYWKIQYPQRPCPSVNVQE